MRTIANKTARSHQADKSDEPLVDACWPAFLRCLRAVFAASGNNNNTTQQRRLPQLQAGLEKTRAFFSNQPSGFFWCFSVFFYFFAQKRVFRIFSASRILLGASRL
jgi:hypothetical protein